MVPTPDGDVPLPDPGTIHYSQEEWDARAKEYAATDPVALSAMISAVESQTAARRYGQDLALTALNILKIVRFVAIA